VRAPNGLSEPSHAREERATLAERTIRAERAIKQESTTVRERAKHRERTSSKERATGTERTKCRERATKPERTITSERATTRERTMGRERATPTERTTQRERAMVKLFDETNEVVREHLDYIAGEGRTPWDAMTALEGVTLSRESVDWEFVERQYREAYRRLPRSREGGLNAR